MSVMAQAPEFAEERRARILDIVNTRGRVKVTELAELLRVAQPTIRKDIAALDQEHRLLRTHGGALAATKPAYEIQVETRRAANADAKRVIAESCVAMLGQNDSIFLDAGTTALAIAEAIGRESSAPAPRFGRNLNVLTNSIAAARALSGIGSIHCTLVGGQYRALADSLVGPIALQSVKQFTVNLAFIGVTGISRELFSVADLGEADLKRAVIGQAHRVVIPMDHSKIGLTDFVSLCGLSDVDVLVTDRADESLARACAASDVQLVVG
jgi:DeoR/GlpR family transcriptional regulator of sugar metabolism